MITNESDPDAFLDMLSSALENFDREDAKEDEQHSCKKICDALRVPRIPYNSITPEDFMRDFSSKNVPVILGDAPEVPMHLNLEYWRRNHACTLVPLDLNTKQERIVKMGDFLKFDSDLSKGYLRSLQTIDW